MFARTDVLKSTVSCVTSAIWARRLASVTSRMSVPSIAILPPVTSQNLGSRFDSVVFPPPELPTSATTSPLRMVSDTP